MKDAMISKVESFLTALGCSSEQALAYISLITSGPQSVLGLSRALKTGRTKLYPLLQDLVLKQIVVAHERHYGTTFEALPVSSLEFLVSEAERRAVELREALPAVSSLLNDLAHPAAGTTKIREHKGIDGLKQVNWALTKAKGRFLVLEEANLDLHAYMNVQFVEKLRRTWVQNKITSFDLTNNPAWNVKTKVRQYKEHFAKAAFIAPEIFKIELETYIYNSCVTLVRYDEPDIVALEIQNASFAHQQAQIFWLLWKMARPLWPAPAA